MGSNGSKGDAVGGFYMSSLYESVDGERVKLQDSPVMASVCGATTMHNGAVMSIAGIPITTSFS